MTVLPSYPQAPHGACLIPLTQGRFAVVDEADYERVSAYRWYFCQGYAVRTVELGGRETRFTILLHRFLLDPPDGFEVDHINGDTLDCRRANLRVATRSQNMANCGLRSTNTSGYKGVSRNKKLQCWAASIKADGIQHCLGLFDSADEAALAYNKAAIVLFGPFARLNVLPDGTTDAGGRMPQPHVDGRSRPAYRAAVAERTRAYMASLSPEERSRRAQKRAETIRLRAEERRAAEEGSES